MNINIHNTLNTLFEAPKTLHQHYLNLPAIARAAIWGGLGCMAYHGLIQAGNEGFVNDVVFIPIIEEIAFRGALHTGIEKIQKIWNRFRGTTMDDASIRNRVLASATIFGFAHSSTPLLWMWDLGRGTGYLYEQTGSLFAPTALHMAENFTALTIENFPKRIPYSVLFYAMGKKMSPIPDCVFSAVKNVARWAIGKMRPRQDSNL